MSTTIQFKRGLDDNFTPVVLATGEPAFVVDTGKFYIGDGADKTLINPINKPEDLDVTDYYSKVKVNEYGQVIKLENLSASDLPAISASQITGLGSAAVLNTGTGANDIPVLDSNGKLLSETIPSIAITDTFVVSSLSQMLAIDAQAGDVCVRTDINETFILQVTPASVEDNWVKILQPLNSVLSVNGKVGTVVLSSSDVHMTGYTKAVSYSPVADTDSISEGIGKLETNFKSYAPLDSPTFTGLPKAPTQTLGDNSASIATTAYVAAAIQPLAPIASPIFSGSPKAPTPAASDNSTNIATTAFVQYSMQVIDGGTF